MELSDPFGLSGVVLEGQYRVDAVVGEGGFGVVYRGFHLAFEQPVAVKVLKVPVVEDVAVRDAVLAKFKDEARLLFTLSQASLSVVRSIDFGAAVTPSGVWAPYMVLEWLEGRSLEQDLRERRKRGLAGRTVEEALAILESAAAGLAVAHERKVAHRDVKPANFFLCEGADRRTKVLDFGIAKLMRDEDTMTPGTRSAFSSFTWLYAAPEQLDPRVGATGPWSDVYSFALVLTELLTDRAPVDATDAVSILRGATDRANRPTPRARGANVSDVVEAVCRRALDVSPEVRYPNIRELWDALSAAALPLGGAAGKGRSTMQVQSVPSGVPRPVAAPSGHVQVAAPAGGHPLAPTVAAASGRPAPIATPPPMVSHRPHGVFPRAPAPMVAPTVHPGTVHPGTVHPGFFRRTMPRDAGWTTALIVGGVLTFIAALVFSACAAGLAQAC